jgi:predicted CXXCH cytochrome family protein
MVWPGPSPPARGEADAPGKCLNCHDPHGWPDNAGQIPFLAIGREEKLCNQCHDGAPASTNIWSDFQLPFRHPAGDRTDVHRGPTEARPEDFGFAPEDRRHAECVDCHNPHVARTDRLASAAQMPKSLLGVGRVAVVNGPVGTAPAYTFVPGRDTLSFPGGEYQVCFKCHSSWTTQPPGQQDLATLFNTNNRSFHPVEATGRNTNIRPGAFNGAWSARSRTSCSDCHGGDAFSAAGPHGSTEPHLLRRRYETAAFGGGPPPSGLVRSPVPGSSADPGQLCFLCHQYDVYANSASPSGMLAQSRFNPPGTAGGHAKHVLDYGVSCYSCHDSHGVADQPHLIATGRTPGITSFTEGATGGDCGPTCHVPRNYAINYPR